MRRSPPERADDDVYALVLGAIGPALGWEFGAAWEGAGELRCVATWTNGTVDAAAFAEATRATILAPGEGLPGRVWRDGVPAWLEDFAAEDAMPRHKAAVDAGLHTALAFPVRSERGVLAVVEFFAAERRIEDRGVLETMEGLGLQGGQVVERRRTEEALIASEERKRAMLDASLDCVVTIDHEGCVLDFNPAAERTFGLSAAQALGREMAELIVPPDLRESHRRGLARYVSGGEPHMLDRRIEIEAIRADGARFPVELTITRIDVPGPPTFTGYLRDITERRRSEAELRASRTRIVEAADAARRRIERDLHDGAQQRLVGVALSLQLARQRLGSGGEAVRELLDEAIADLGEATAELRELARGIHPAVLTEGGLEAALRSLVMRSAVPAMLVEAPAQRLPSATEAAAYFVAAEGLTNVARYAQARSAEIRVSLRDGRLVIEVHDDGAGGADPANGSGLRGLSDRLATLDGTLTVESPPGAGTTIRGVIPCE
jgi:PAS domain S-box-containing protein